MRRVANGCWLALALSGCSSVLGIDEFKLVDGGPGGGDADVADAPPIDTPPGCLGSNDFLVCLPQPPTNDLVIGNQTGGLFSTDPQNSMCQPAPASWTQAGQPDACFVIGRDVLLQGLVRVSGPRPLVIVAAGTLHVAVDLDVASHGNLRGPGAPSLECMPAQPASPGTNGGGGGAGGTFLTSGGDGGQGVTAQGGFAFAQPPGAPPRLRAGCDGAVGARGRTVDAQPGSGGGAVALIAGGRIQIDASINASGSGGLGGIAVGGGGGGGSGGMIVLHAPMITGTGRVFANGGGGGGGADPQQQGQPGQDPAAPSQPANGGNGAPTAGVGGAGAVNMSRGQPGGAAAGPFEGGGGGGGGGLGYIRTNLPLQGIAASPLPHVVP